MKLKPFPIEYCVKCKDSTPQTRVSHEREYDWDGSSCAVAILRCVWCRREVWPVMGFHSKRVWRIMREPQPLQVILRGKELKQRGIWTAMVM
jgi:hypothetical protein